MWLIPIVRIIDARVPDMMTWSPARSVQLAESASSLAASSAARTLAVTASKRSSSSAVVVAGSGGRGGVFENREVQPVLLEHDEHQTRQLHEVRGELAERPGLVVRLPRELRVGHALEDAARGRELVLDVGEGDLADGGGGGSGHEGRGGEVPVSGFQ
jgi:hypothetical protein